MKYVCSLCGTDLIVYNNSGVISVNPCQNCHDESYKDGSIKEYDTVRITIDSDNYLNGGCFRNEFR